MDQTAMPQRDPLVWCAVIALGFVAIAWHGLLIPKKLYFDEIHYIPAARKLLHLLPANREHPLLGKEILAISLKLLGDAPLAWRLPSLLFGGLGLFAFGRLTWWLSGLRFATIAAMLLLASDFAWFIQSRIAMLDMFAAALLMVALWQFAAAMRGARRPRLRLALSGLFMGLALGAKWSVLPLLPLPGLTFLCLYLRKDRLNNDFPSISLIEAGVWLSLVPMVIYWVTFAPALFYPTEATRITLLGFVEQHRQMLALQESVLRPHQYQSVWYEWVINWRPIWYLYENIQGAQRGVLLLGNPLTMLAGLGALAWCGWAAWRHGRTDALAFAVLYLAGMGFWISAMKPVQFYYHYLLPGTFLMGCLALALDALFARGGRRRWGALAGVAASLAIFAWFHPIISASALTAGKVSYQRWMWMNSWR